MGFIPCLVVTWFPNSQFAQFELEFVVHSSTLALIRKFDGVDLLDWLDLKFKFGEFDALIQIQRNKGVKLLI